MMLLTNYQGSALVVSDKKIFSHFPNVQEVFHVYLNKFENVVTHLFLILLGYN